MCVERAIWRGRAGMATETARVSEKGFELRCLVERDNGPKEVKGSVSRFQCVRNQSVVVGS